MRVEIGYDPREHEAFEVCRHSILRRSTDAAVTALKQDFLREVGLYNRCNDPLASTEFAFTRFLVPALARMKAQWARAFAAGDLEPEHWVLFCDCDFLFTAPLAELFALAEDRYAVMVVKHDHRPPEKVKKDGRAQTLYPRKNWSSLVLWNVTHAANEALSADVVNNAAPLFLHQFRWLRDEEIGALPETWNWLEGWSPKPGDGSTPKGIHFTRGGPWFEGWRHVDHAELWLEEHRALKQARAEQARVEAA